MNNRTNSELLQFPYNVPDWFSLEADNRRKSFFTYFYYIGDLYVQYYDEIYRYIYLFTLNRYDTEDILHNTFVKVMQGINSFKGKSDVKTWLLAIAHNECVNHFKKIIWKK